jgi:hypothetical protein
MLTDFVRRHHPGLSLVLTIGILTAVIARAWYLAIQVRHGSSAWNSYCAQYRALFLHWLEVEDLGIAQL